MAANEKDSNKNASPSGVPPTRGSPQPMYMDRSEDHVPDHIILSIISIFFCFLFGIFAIIKANEANTMKHRPGGLQPAKRAASAAKMWAIIAIIIGVVPYFVGLVFTLVSPLFSKL